MSQLHIYRSAAGAGKTYVLVKTYLTIALDDPDNFRKILAVTFTNQATQEMKRRILTSLYTLAKGDIDTPLASELMVAKRWTSQILQQNAAKVLSQILHHYDHFNISTIDSFLQMIVRNFSRELGIQHGFSIEMDQEAVLSQVIREVLIQAADNMPLRKWLIHFAEHKLLSGKSWRVHQIIQQLGRSLFTETFSQQVPALIAATREPTVLTTFMEQLTENLSSFESQLQSCGTKAIGIIEESTLAVQDFAYGKQGVAGFLAGLAHKKNFIPTKRAHAAASNIEAWYSKTSPYKKEIEAIVKYDLQSLLQEAIHIYEQQHSMYYTGKAVQELIYAFGVMTHLLQALRRYRTANNVLLISDTANLLRQIIAHNETPFVYEKIGAFYNHFLIDEFQDISTFQWQNIQPLVANGLSMGHMSLVVGDVKQSIYRWRGGAWQLLAHGIEQTFIDSQNVVLSYNWRSKPNIIWFNNAFFKQANRVVIQYLQQEISKLENTKLHAELTLQLQELTTVYTNVAQQIPPGRDLINDLGYVEVNCIEHQNLGNEKQDWKNEVKTRLPALLEQIQDAGFSIGDVAILVRNHAESKELLQLLLNYQNTTRANSAYSYMAFSDESLTLAHNPFVNLLISALHYVENPEDQLVKATLVYLYQVYINQQPITIHHNFWVQALANEECKDGCQVLPKAFTHTYQELYGLPLYERVEKIIKRLGLLSPISKPFITAFQDIVFSYIKNETKRSTYIDFLTWWDSTKHRHVLPGTKKQNAASIMTIHQAKGLEFKIVIVPFCNWDMDHNITKAPTLWCATDVPPFTTFPSLPLCYNSKLINTSYAKEYYQERMQVHMDNINLLYVAFTRATDRLYIFTPHKTYDQLDTTAELIQQTIKNNLALHPDAENPLAWKIHWNDSQKKLSIG